MAWFCALSCNRIAFVRGSERRLGLSQPLYSLGGEGVFAFAQLVIGWVSIKV